MSAIVLLTVPWDGHRDVVASLREHLSGKLVISCVKLTSVVRMACR